MGASSWHYFTPYQPDVERALQQLRQGVFARREYSFGMGGFAGPDAPVAGPGGFPGVPPGFLDTIAQLQGQQGRLFRAAMSGDYAGLSAEERHAAEQIRPLFQAGGADEDDEDDEDEPPVFPPGHQPATIDELLEMVAEDGTHSILDIERTARRQEFGAAIPMPPARLREFFNTTQPTHDQVDQLWMDVAEELDRWEAFYLTVYRDGKPHEYAFIGCSGD